MTNTIYSIGTYSSYNLLRTSCQCDTNIRYIGIQYIRIPESGSVLDGYYVYLYNIPTAYHVQELIGGKRFEL
jgi:hypothetical protein